MFQETLVYILEFAKLNDMPISLDIRRINDGDGIKTALMKNQAQYHESCRLLFNSTKLKWAQKKHHPSKINLEGWEISSKFIRRSTSVPTENQSSMHGYCFICEKQVPLTELLEAMTMTMKLNNERNWCAHNLQDPNLLAKLSTGDAVAQEIKYHCTCLRGYVKEFSCTSGWRLITHTILDALSWEMYSGSNQNLCK